jgi:FtsP/CotA-like multicopper oxidase with cupredoxin domain/pSer/pThr/pTyr-binding forkhead associated (FHA) protein
MAGLPGTRRILGPGAGEVHDVDRELVIGREGADIIVLDAEVSRRHAIVRPVAAGVELEDLGSSNGTFIDGRRIEGAVTLSETTIVRLGGSELTVEVDVPQPTRVRAVPPPTDVTQQRERPTLAPSDVTALRATPAAAAAASPPETTPSGRRRKLAALIAGGGLLVAAIAVALVLVFGGSSSSSTKVAATSGHCDSHFPNVIKDGFPEPPMIFSHDGVLNATLTATTDTIHVNGHTWQGLEYNGMSPGPTWVICPGDVLNVHLINKLPIPTNLHVHGLHVDPTGNHDNIFVTLNPLQGFNYNYQIPLDQSPGAFWYHPHWHPLVDAETTAGMLGAIVVEGGLDNVLPKIPQRLILISGGKPCAGPVNSASGTNCTQLPIPGTKPGQVKPPPSPGPSELLVNGVYQPTLHIQPGQLQRWRIWNSTGEHMVDLALSGATFQVLADDGNTLRSMQPEQTILLGPGSRVEVLVRGAAAGRYALESLPFQPCFRGCFDPFGGVPNNGRNFGYQTLINVISSGTPVNDPLPSGPLANPPDLRSAHVDVNRTIVMARTVLPLKPPAFPLNNQLFDANRIDVTMALNSVEQWTISSPATALNVEWHNFHLHTNPFQVIAINGKPLNYIYWADTVNIPAGGSVTIRIHPIDFTGKAVFHCHIDFHEDNGMMSVFQIVKDPPPSQVNAERVIYMAPPAQQTAPANLWAEATNTTASGWAKLLLLCHLGLSPD